MIKENRYLISSGLHWQETPGLLRSALLRIDSEAGAIIHDEKQAVSPASDAFALRERAQCIAQLARKVGLIAGSESMTFDYPDKALVFEPIKSSFTREAGSLSR